MQLSTYLFFDGNAEQALTFYTQALGAEVLHKIRFGEAPVDDSQCATTPPFPADKIMHASLKIGDGLLMLSDGNMCAEEKKHGGFSVSLHSNDLAQGKTWFERLSVGANVDGKRGKRDGVVLIGPPPDALTKRVIGEGDSKIKY